MIDPAIAVATTPGFTGDLNERTWDGIDHVVGRLADTLSAEAENLDAEVRRFLADVQAA